MNRGVTGRYETTFLSGETVRAFVPAPLPPDPPLEVTPTRRKLLEEATLALGRLDSITLLLPDPELFLYSYVRREAVLSSQIEGTQSTLTQLMLFELEESPGVPFEDVVEVSNYVAALEHGVARLREGFPLSNRLIREMHAVLLSRGRGSNKDPGEFRRSQNWIGGTRPGNALFVPPPPHLVPECMADLERFLHDENNPYPSVLKAALAHVQFETIHPFLDGNGRIGRLLIAFILHHDGILSHPLLYLSLYFKRHRETYYRLLDRVRTEGDWEAWTDFFLEGVRDTAGNAVETARRLIALFEADQQKIQALGRSASSTLRVFQAFKERPLLTVSRISERTGLSFPAANQAVARMAELGIVREITGRRRERAYAYDQYVAILNEGTEE
jgi:Fic family protein